METTVANEPSTVEDYEQAERDERWLTDELLMLHDRSRSARADFQKAADAGDEVGMHDAVTRMRAYESAMANIAAGIRRVSDRKRAAEARRAHAHAERARQHATAARQRSHTPAAPRMDVTRNTRVRRVVRVIAKATAKSTADPESSEPPGGSADWHFHGSLGGAL